MRERASIARRLSTLITAAALATLGFMAVSTSAAHATTSVEGNCESTVTPVVTAVDDGGVNTSVDVTWHDECTNVDYYNIERSDDGGATWTTIATVLTFTRNLAPPSQDGEYLDVDLPCGTYIYRVDAVHAPGHSLPKVSVSLESAPITITVSEDCGGGGGQGTCDQLTGALTLGYYSNKNGQATITGSDLTALSALNLRTATGGNFDPTTKAQLKTWLLNGTATNMSYMLSVQLATLELNILHGLVDPNDVLCQVPGTPTIGDVADAANTFLGLYPTVYGGDPNRVDGDALQTLINEINNDLVTVS